MWALSEMFPESIRNVCESATEVSIKCTKTLYKFSCSASWIFFTSSMILFAPILFETERAQMIEMEKSQKQRASLFCSVLFKKLNRFYVWFCLFTGFVGTGSSSDGSCRIRTRFTIVTTDGTIKIWNSKYSSGEKRY